VKVVDDGDRGEDGVMTAMVKTNVPALIGAGTWFGMGAVWTAAPELAAAEFAVPKMDADDNMVESAATRSPVRLCWRVPGRERVQVRRRTRGGRRS
jgi:hypothetical protein